MSTLVLLVLLFSGCRSLHLPPGVQRENGTWKNSFPDTLSAETRYALLTWYLDSQNRESLDPSLLAYIHELQTQAADKSNRTLAEKLAAQTGPLVRLDASGGLRIDPTLFADNTDWNSMSDMLGKLRDALKTPLSAAPSDAEIDLLFGNESDARAFRSWLSAHPVMIPETGVLQRQELLTSLDQIQDVLALKRRLLDSKAEVNALLESGFGGKALNLLDETRKNLSANSSLALIGDTSTLADFERTRQELPEKILDSELAPIEKTLFKEIGTPENLARAANPAQLQRLLETCERSFSEHLQTWFEDKRYENSLNKNKERLVKLASSAAALRSTLWTQQIEKLAANSEFWEAAAEYKAWRQLLSDAKAPELLLYFKLRPDGKNIEHFAKAIEKDLTVKFRSILPAAFKEYLSAADHASHIANKHGICLTLCEMLQDLIDLAGGESALEDELVGKLPKIQEFRELSLRILKKDVLQRSLVINEMSSGIPGLGMTYARDLENILRNLLAIPGLAPMVQVADSGVPPGTQDYVIFGGIIADYNGSELVERSTMRSVIRHDEIQKVNNPDYNPEAPPTAPQRLTAKFLYRQNELEQVITVKEVERLAHLRIFFNLKGPGVIELIELNEFYSRKFAIEQSHLFNDVHRKRVIESFDSATLTVPEAPPVLLNDRIWSTGEMLDFARKDSLNIFSLKVLYHLQLFPLFLARRAEKLALDGETQESAEFWGRCLTVCEQLDVVPEISTLLKFEQTPAATCFAADMKKLQNRQAELQELKKNVTQKAFAQTCDYLRKKRNQ
jgi:hypothetical protein